MFNTRNFLNVILMQGTSSERGFSGLRLLIAAAAMVGAIALAIVAWRFASIIIFSPDIRNVPNPGFQVGVEINGEFQTNDLILIPTGTSFMPAFRISGIKNDDVDEVKYWLDGKELDPNKHIILPKMSLDQSNSKLEVTAN